MKEKVIERWYLDEVFQRDEMVNLTVYQRKDGEYVHFIKGYRKITYRENNIPVLEIKSKTIKSFTLNDLISN